MPSTNPPLLDALEQLTAPWTGTVWRRVVEGTYPLRPNSRGARWNPPGTEALYGSLTDAGAEAELESMLARQPIPIRKPLATHQLTVAVDNSADVRGNALSELGFPAEVLTGDDWKIPQRIGAAAVWLGLAALIVPSARHEDGNIVIFVNELGREDLVDLAG